MAFWFEGHGDIWGCYSGIQFELPKTLIDTFSFLRSLKDVTAEMTGSLSNLFPFS